MVRVFKVQKNYKEKNRSSLGVLRRGFFWGLLLILGFLFLSSCDFNKKSQDVTGVAVDPIYEKGRAVYISNCISCHNVDPSQNGSIGPAVKNSSIELLEARILHAKYPDGYKPKRSSAQMPAFPELKDDIPALFKFLNH